MSIKQALFADFTHTHTHTQTQNSMLLFILFRTDWSLKFWVLYNTNYFTFKMLSIPQHNI